jgi:predicted 3-demethylubiquinone-9 3-methyltransferase (glyoxalase superfamily)
MTVRSITPFLWFDRQAEEAAIFYTGLFPNSRILQVSRYGKNMPGPEGSVMVVDAQIAGQRVHMMNGGPSFTLSMAFSLMVACEDQAEIDRLWTALLEGGQAHACGWITDRFGLTWQINYAGWPDLLEKNSQKAMEAMMTMVKIDIQQLKNAVA